MTDAKNDRTSIPKQSSAWDSSKLKISTLQVILKTAERCNLNCPYCYYFYGGDESYKNRPPIIKPDTIQQIASFLAQGAKELKVPHVQIVAHGGEPMLQKPAHFAAMCDQFQRSLNGIAAVSFGIQTNGTLISDEWLQVFQKYNVFTGVSMDGTPDIHDKFRVDKKGNGSHAKIVDGVSQYQNHPGDLPELGMIGVIDPTYDYKKIVNHYVDDVGFKRLAFLLPDYSLDEGFPDGLTARDYGEVLCDIFDVWEERGDFKVREFEDIFERFQLAKPTEEFLKQKADLESEHMICLSNQIIVIHSDGEITVDDTYIPARGWYQNTPKGHVSETTLKNWLNHPVFAEIQEVYDSKPDGCNDCMWYAICGGGTLENRYSDERDFNNPSLYCDSLKQLYERVVKHLYQNGYPMEEIVTRLAGREDSIERYYAA